MAARLDLQEQRIAPGLPEEQCYPGAHTDTANTDDLAREVREAVLTERAAVIRSQAVRIPAKRGVEPGIESVVLDAVRKFLDGHDQWRIVDDPRLTVHY